MTASLSQSFWSPWVTTGAWLSSLVVGQLQFAGNFGSPLGLSGEGGWHGSKRSSEYRKEPLTERPDVTGVVVWSSTAWASQTAAMFAVMIADEPGWLNVTLVAWPAGAFAVTSLDFGSKVEGTNPVRPAHIAGTPTWVASADE